MKEINEDPCFDIILQNVHSPDISFKSLISQLQKRQNLASSFWNISHHTFYLMVTNDLNFDSNHKHFRRLREKHKK